MRLPPPLPRSGRTRIRLGRRTLSYFSGCDYFRLANHPLVMVAASDTMRKHGLNVAASRMTTGNHPVYVELEKRLAVYFGAPSALLVSTGYLANAVVAQALAGTFSHALMDDHAHPSLVDASRFLDCPVLKFQHRDPADAARAIRRCGPGAKLILLTDGMFSRDGSVAPLSEYLHILPKDAAIVVDDAHGAGVLGSKGKGTLEQEGVGRARIIQTMTLSKAFGAYGGVVLSDQLIRRKILARSHAFAGSTPPPLPLASAALASLKVLGKDKAMRRRLWKNVAYVRDVLRVAGVQFPETPGPVIFLRPRRSSDSLRLCRRLLAAGIYPPFLEYPNGPAGGYFRFVISSEHTRGQLDALIAVFTAFRKM